jgi:hypothetical protein
LPTLLIINIGPSCGLYATDWNPLMICYLGAS